MTHDPGPSWEPMEPSAVQRIVALARSATAVEGEVLAQLAEAPDDTVPGELVAWAWVLDEAHDHVLLVDHRRFGVWLPPGGRAQPGEHPLAAAVRELTEETGVVARLAHDEPAFADAVARRSPTGRSVTTFGFAYLFIADRQLPLQPEPGQPAAWWPLAEPPLRRAEHHWQRLTRHLDTRRPNDVT